MQRRNFISTCATLVSGLALSGCQSVSNTQASVKLDAAAFRTLMRFASTRFGRIAYVEHGRGPVALFLHGFPLNGYQWRGALERLSPYRRCIAPDFMGLGYTDAPDQQDLSPQAQSDMLAALLDQLSIPAVDLVANDSGGTIAQLFVVQHPKWVRSMLLTNCDVHENSPPPQMKNSIATARAGQYDQKMARHLEDRVYARSPNGIGGAAYMDPASFTDEAIDYYFKPFVSSPLRRTQLNLHLAGFEPNPLLAIESALRRSQVPTRIVWGTADPLFPVVWAEWLNQTLPESRGIRLVEGGRLFWPEELPDLLADEAKMLWNA